jgi:hypothetical protein
VAVSVAVTAAPETGLPLGSVTVPDKLPPSLAHSIEPARPNKTAQTHWQSFPIDIPVGTRRRFCILNPPLDRLN